MRNQPRPEKHEPLGMWGRKTIAFAMVLRAAEGRSAVDDPETLWRLMTDAQEIAQDLWISALGECTRAEDPSEFQERFLAGVFGWCAEHLVEARRADG